MKDYTSNDSGWKVGDKVLTFDPAAWSENGGDSKQDDFMRPATIINIRYEDLSNRAKWYQERFKPRLLADIRWDKTGEESYGHFPYAFKKR